jgi:hypothetical protein
VCVAVGHVPVVVANQGVPIGVARHETQFGLKSFDGDKDLLSLDHVNMFRVYQLLWNSNIGQYFQ